MTPKRARTFSGLLLLCLLLSGLPIKAHSATTQLGIAAEGRLIPGDGLHAIGTPPGSILHSLRVKTGDKVKQGDLLAHLSGYPIAQSAATRARLEAEAASAAVAVAKAQFSAAQAAADAAKAQILIAEKQVAEAQAAHTAASAAQTRALAEHDATTQYFQGKIAEYQRILDEVDPPRREREEITVQQNMLRLEAQRHAATRSSMESELQANLAQAQSAIDAATSALDAAHATAQHAQAEAVAARSYVNQVQMQAEAARAAIAQAEAETRLQEVRAPIDGRVIAINTLPGEQVGPMGVLYLGDTSNMIVEAQIYVDDVRRIKPGQKATISGSAIEGNHPGTVQSIGLMVTPANLYHPDPTIFTDRRIVLARIALDDSTPFAHLTHAQVTVRINPAQDN